MVNWTLAVSLSLLILAVPNALWAQYGAKPKSVVPPGEQYVAVEFMGAFWNPTPALIISSESIGIPGTDIDFVRDLGIEKDMHGEFRLILRPSRKSKFRIELVSIDYTASAPPTRDIVFNGQRFPATIPIDSRFDWNAWRFGYEYDFVVGNWGFAGFIVDVKYTDVTVNLSTPLLPGVQLDEFTMAKAPIPSLGGIVRGYVVPQVSITGEITGFKLPNFDDEYQARYIDYNFYGTVSFNRYVGAVLGYRAFDLSYRIEDDAGDSLLKGWYFGGVVRF